jgi:hypothetical protein
MQRGRLTGPLKPPVAVIVIVEVIDRPLARRWLRRREFDAGNA